MHFNIQIDKRVIKPLAKLGYPVVAGNIGLVVMMLVDNAMVGALGHVELAASGISNTVFFVTSIFGIGTLTVFSASIAAHLKGKRPNPGSFINNTLLIGALVAIFTFLFMLFIHYNFQFLNQPIEVNYAALPYFKVLIFSVLPMFVYLSFKNILDGHSRTLPAMFATLSAVLLNAFLNWVLIYGHLGFKSYGLVGAGYATFISRCYMALFVIIFVFVDPKISYFLASVKEKVKQSELIRLFKIGIPSGLQFFYEVTAFSAAAIMAGWLGARFLAAHQIAIGLVSFTYMFANGISVAAMIKTGEATAGKAKKNIYHIGINAIYLTGASMLFFALVLVFFNKSLVNVFTDDQEVILIASGLLYIASVFQLFDGTQVVSMGILRGLGDTKIPSRITLFAYWIFALPTSYLLGFYTSLGINGIWLGLTLGLCAAAVLLFRRFIFLTKST